MASSMRPHASKQDYRDAFAGLVFPTSQPAIVRRARDNGGVDHEVKVIVDQLPERTYRSLEELEAAVRMVYLARGVSPAALPI